MIEGQNGLDLTPTQSEEVSTLIAKLIEVRTHVPKIPKKGKHPVGFSYHRTEDVLAVLGPILDAHGIFITHSVLAQGVDRNNVYWCTTAHTFYCMESGQWLRVFSQGTGKDETYPKDKSGNLTGETRQGDKALYKAVTTSTRNFYLKNFRISEVEDVEFEPEHEEQHGEVRPELQPAPKAEKKPPAPSTAPEPKPEAKKEEPPPPGKPKRPLAPGELSQVFESAKDTDQPDEDVLGAAMGIMPQVTGGDAKKREAINKICFGGIEKLAEVDSGRLKAFIRWARVDEDGTFHKDTQKELVLLWEKFNA